MPQWAAAAGADTALAVPANSHSDARWRYARSACISRFVVLPVTAAALINV